MWFESSPIKLEVLTSIFEPMTLWGYIFHPNIPTKCKLGQLFTLIYLFINNMYLNDLDTHKFANVYPISNLMHV
jgi:hypothetical protein